MSNWWLRFGCFLTGYKYRLLAHCSVASEKVVNKYTSALLVVCLIWGGIGYFFTAKYITGTFAKGGFDFKGVLAAAVMIFVAIQIERQIILSFGKNRAARWFRGGIGVIMALIGSIIIDQILFYKEIENKKGYLVEQEVKRLLPSRVSSINASISNLKSEAEVLKSELEKLSNEPAVIPVGKVFYEQKVIRLTLPDGRDSIRLVPSAKVLEVSESNPKYAEAGGVRERINQINSKIYELDSLKIGIQNSIEVYDPGFLDELRAMWMVLFDSGSWLPPGVWLLFFALFFSIELFILVNKMFDAKSDYDYLVQHQMTIRIEQLKAVNDNLENSISE